MSVDILIAVIVVVTMVQSYRRGLIETVIRTAGWFAALAFSFVLTPAFKAFIMDNTDFYQRIYLNINEKVSLMLTPAELQTDLPAIIQTSFIEFTSNIAASAADSISNGLALLCLSVLSFLILAVFFNLLFRVILAACSKKHNHGIIGALDGFAGMLLGFVKGLVYVFLLLAFLVPLASMAKPETADLIFESLNSSFIGLELYNNNLIMLIIQDLL